MNKYAFPEAKCIVVCGDIHGEFYQLIHKCCVHYGMTDTVIIVAGDCGFGFESRDYYEAVYKKLQKRLASSNCWLVMLRGNHDNPAYFNSYPIKHRRFLTIPDYSVIEVCNHKILCVGGAISVDRSYRKTSTKYHKSQDKEPLAPNIYWSDEAPFLNTSLLDEINKSCIIDIVITHTAPSFCELVSKTGLLGWFAEDDCLMNDLKLEREVMDKLHDTLVRHQFPRYWFYGHFHQSWHCKIDNVMFRMLDIMELHEIH